MQYRVVTAYDGVQALGETADVVPVEVRGRLVEGDEAAAGAE